MSKSEQILLEHIRAVTDEDRERLPQFSYSRIEQYLNCPMSYKLKYVDGNETLDTSLALELGSLCHYVLETKGKMLLEDKIDYRTLEDMLYKGVEIANEDSEKPTEKFAGVNELRQRYFEEWGVKDKTSGLDYNDKIKLFWNNVLPNEMESDPWEPTYFERHFEFVFDNRVILHGFIDRIDTRSGVYRVVDYKTSKKIYDEKKTATSLQFGIYALSILNEFGQLPVESLYRFILLDKSQRALTLGWETRLIKKLTEIFDKIDHDRNNDEFKPSPTPLCHWCNFCKHNPNAKDFKHLCQYYSLWTPEKKSFAVNRKWEDGPMNSGRKLIW